MVREDQDDTGPFDIYETQDGPRHVANPVRRLLLAQMRGQELTVAQMIDATGLTKSTISTHLAVLHRESLVHYREDPVDRRKKRYYLTARHVGSTRRCCDRLPFHDATEAGAEDGSQVGRLLLRALLAELTCSGLDLGPVVRETGRRVGELLGQDGPEAPDLDTWVTQAQDLWARTGLGTLTVATTDPLVLRVAPCGLCFAEADPRLSLSSVTAGILEGHACERLHTVIEVHPIEDPGPGPQDSCGCAFAVHVAQDEPEATDATAAARSA